MVAEIDAVDFFDLYNKNSYDGRFHYRKDTLLGSKFLSEIGQTGLKEVTQAGLKEIGQSTTKKISSILGREVAQSASKDIAQGAVTKGAKNLISDSFSLTGKSLAKEVTSEASETALQKGTKNITSKIAKVGAALGIGTGAAVFAFVPMKDTNGDGKIDSNDKTPLQQAVSSIVDLPKSLLESAGFDFEKAKQYFKYFLILIFVIIVAFILGKFVSFINLIKSIFS